MLENAEFTKRLLLREYTGVVNNPLSTKLSYSKLKNAVLNSSKSFLAFKIVSPRDLPTYKRSLSKKMGKTPSSHIIHSLDSEPIRLLKSPRSLSVDILITDRLVSSKLKNVFFFNFLLPLTSPFRAPYFDPNGCKPSPLTMIARIGRR